MKYHLRSFLGFVDQQIITHSTYFSIKDGFSVYFYVYEKVVNPVMFLAKQCSIIHVDMLDFMYGISYA